MVKFFKSACIIHHLLNDDPEFREQIDDGFEIEAMMIR